MEPHGHIAHFLREVGWGGGRRRPRGFAGAAGCPRWWQPPLQPRVPQTGAEDGCPQSAPCWPPHTSPRMAAVWRSSEVPWPVRHCSDPRPVASPSLLRSQTRRASHTACVLGSLPLQTTGLPQNWKCPCCFRGAPADLEDGGHQTIRGYSRGLDDMCFPGPGADPALTSGPSPERDSLGGCEDRRMNKGEG